jgi:hypothetical protein
MNPKESSSPDPLHQELEAYKELDFSKDHSLLSCPKCNHFISGKDINIENTIARCSHCNHVFGFEHDSKSQKLKPTQIIPEGVEVLKLRSELDIRLKWEDTTSKSGRWFLTLFTGLWNLLVLPFVLMVIIIGEWGILLFLSAHLLVGLGLLWHLATIYLNRTSISVTQRRIRVRTFPFRHFLWKNKEIQNDQINQLYVSKYVQSTTNGEPNYAFALYAIVKSGEKICLIRGMNRETQMYIEKEIEDFLGIKNRKVPEETGVQD